MDLVFNFKLFLLKQNFKRFCRYKNLYEDQVTKREAYKYFFIKDKEDEDLNKSILEKFDKKIKKYRTKKYKSEIKIDKLLFSLNIYNSDYLSILYQKRVSLKNVSLIKEILKKKIINKFEKK